MKDLSLILGIFAICSVLVNLVFAYLIVKLDDITSNLEDRFNEFNEELIILSDVLKEYHNVLDQVDIPLITENKNVSGW